MPTYDYECEACGHTLEHFQSMSSRKLRKCPVCQKPKLVRLVGSGAGVIFKGSGFYETDYKRAGSSGSGDGSSKSDAKSGNGASGKQESAKKGEQSSSGGSGKADAPSDRSPKKESGAEPKA
jgi:putative FmdB family regulatory protein